MEREEFRCHADECLRMADCTRDPADKAAWMRLAQIWLRSAFEAERGHKPRAAVGLTAIGT